MKVYDTTGKLHNWNPKSNPRFKKSTYHTNALALLKSLYPLDQILEEVSVPGEQMFLDLYLPGRKLVIEVNGQQHYEYNSHFYADKSEWRQAVLRDKRKQEWCEINGLDLVVLGYNEDEQQWKRNIIDR